MPQPSSSAFTERMRAYRYEKEPGEGSVAKITAGDEQSLKIWESLGDILKYSVMKPEEKQVYNAKLRNQDHHQSQEARQRQLERERERSRRDRDSSARNAWIVNLGKPPFHFKKQSHTP